MRLIAILTVFTALLTGTVSYAQLSPDDLVPARPMIMPAAGQPSPATWMFGQAYGNTTGAYNFGDRWYRAGQGLHFGVDLSMPCGTPLVAVADGTVMFVDDKGFGSDPHNLILRHDELGVTTLYGHLLDRPNLMPGQFVQQGDLVGLSGDPDSTCTSRPHLHFEIRSLDYSRTLNPHAFIEAHWHTLSLIGPYGFPLFQQNLENPRQWITLNDQPDVYFWGRILNNYTAAYPPRYDREPAPFPALERQTPAALDSAPYTLRQLTTDGCCAMAHWHPTDPNTLYTVDGGAGSLASVFERSLNDDGASRLRPAPMPYLAANGAFEVEPFINGFSKVRRIADGTEYSVNTNNRIPTLNLSNTKLLWAVSSDAVVPGQTRPNTSIYTSDINGENVQEIHAEPGADARWLDDNRVLISARNEQRQTTLHVYMLDTAELITLGQWREMRGLSVSPGGRYISFYLSWQDDPTTNGVYMIDLTQPGTITQMPWFGGWRWRDADSVYYIPYEPEMYYHTLRIYDLNTSADTLIADPTTLPFAIADGHWEVSADGARILFQNLADGRNLYILEPDL